jgi:hypothetical protein
MSFGAKYAGRYILKLTIMIYVAARDPICPISDSSDHFSMTYLNVVCNVILHIWNSPSQPRFRFSPEGLHLTDNQSYNNISAPGHESAPVIFKSFSVTMEILICCMR